MVLNDDGSSLLIRWWMMDNLGWEYSQGIFAKDGKARAPVLAFALVNGQHSPHQGVTKWRPPRTVNLSLGFAISINFRSQISKGLIIYSREDITAHGSCPCTSSVPATTRAPTCPTALSLSSWRGQHEPWKPDARSWPVKSKMLDPKVANINGHVLESTFAILGHSQIGS